MSDYPNQNQGVPQGSEAIKHFQLTTAGIEKKSSKEYGLAISKDIWAKSNTGVGGYYYNRNARFFKNRNYSNGRMDVQAMFKDRFQFNSKDNYINLNWQALQIVNRIISGLVGRWMQRNEKIQVTAIDTLSVKEKQEQYENIIDRYIKLFEKKHGLELDHWVSNDKSGIAFFGCVFYFNVSDILFDINNKLPKGLIISWLYDGIEFREKKGEYINLNSYFLGLRYEQLDDV